MASKPTIQRGFGGIGNTFSSQTLVRGTASGFDTTVDPTKTLLFVTSRTGDEGFLRAVLTDGDTITVTRQNGNGQQLDYVWTLLSFAEGVTVQHKTATIASDGAATTATAAIAGAGSGGRFIIPSGLVSATISTVRSAARWRFTSDTEIEVSCASTDAVNTVAAACQVVEWDNATVQTISWAAETWAATTTDKALSPAVTVASTAIFGSAFVSNDNRDELSAAASLPDTTTLRLTRAGTASVTLTGTFYVVSFAGGVDLTRVASVHTASSLVDTAVADVPIADGFVQFQSIWNGVSHGVTTQFADSRSTVQAWKNSSTNLRTQRGSTTGNVTANVTIWTLSEALALPITNPARLSPGTNGSPLRLVTQQGVGSPIVIR